MVEAVFAHDAAPERIVKIKHDAFERIRAQLRDHCMNVRGYGAIIEEEKGWCDLARDIGSKAAVFADARADFLDVNRIDVRKRAAQVVKEALALREQIEGRRIEKPVMKPVHGRWSFIGEKTRTGIARADLGTRRFF